MKKYSKMKRDYYNLLIKDVELEKIKIEHLKSETSISVRNYIFDIFINKVNSLNPDSNFIAYDIKFENNEFEENFMKQIRRKYHLSEIVSGFIKLCDTDKSLFVYLFEYSVLVKVINPKIILRKETYIEYKSMYDNAIMIYDNLHEELVELMHNPNNYQFLQFQSKPYLDEPFYEESLEDMIVENPSAIEKGLTIIDRQYRVDDGYIDILARDITGTLCVIELKIKDNDKRLVYQAVYYPMQFNEKVRVITITPDYKESIFQSLHSLNYVETKVYYFNNVLKANGEDVINVDDPTLHIVDYDEYIDVKSKSDK